MSVRTTVFGSRYFRYMAIAMMILGVGGFSLFDILHLDKIPRPYPLLIFHASSMVLWFTLFIVQTQLIGRGNYSLHKKLGLLSVLLADALVVIGVGVNKITYGRGSDPVIVAANFCALLNFSIAYSTGYVFRKRAEIHKRAMLFAGIAILAPALGRIVISFGLPEPFVFLLYVSLIGSVIVFDLKKRKRPHIATVLLGVLLIMVLVAAFPLGSSEAWQDFLVRLWGNVPA